MHAKSNTEFQQIFDFEKDNSIKKMDLIPLFEFLNPIGIIQSLIGFFRERGCQEICFLN